MPPALAVIGAVVSVGATVYAAKESAKASRAQAAAAQQQTNMQEAQYRLSSYQQGLSTRRSRMSAIRQSQALRAQTLSTGAAAGALGSSGLQGGIGSLDSQVGSALGIQSQQNAMTQVGSNISSAANARIGAFNQQAINAQSRANIGSSLAGIGGALFQMGGGFNAFAPAPAPASSYYTPTRG